MSLAYRAFIDAKKVVDPPKGFPCEAHEANPLLKPHQRDIVAWAVRGGRRAVFTAFGLGKTIIQLEILRLTLAKSGKTHGLVILPLGVKQEFERDARMLGIGVTFIRQDSEVAGPGIYLTNYESVREGKLDPTAFHAVSLDEASCLRGFGGTKTFREFMRLFEGSDIPRFVATATPSPNEFIELLAYSAFLDVMDVGQAKTRFFRRNSEKADQLTIHPHKVAEFWLWVASWGLFVQKPSDLGYSDEGYELPPLSVTWHEVESDHTEAGCDRTGQSRMFADASLGVVESAGEKRRSIASRIKKMLELRSQSPTDHRIIWHDLESERLAIEQAIPGIVSVYGNQPLDEREAAIIGFSEGQVAEIAGKPSMLGSGCNFQRHCHRAIFLGIGFKFNDFIQAIHRLQRFLQEHPVEVEIIYTEGERGVRAELERKWAQHNEMAVRMSEIIKEFGLSEAAIADQMVRAATVERVEESGNAWTLVNNDCVDECAAMPSNSVGLILTSIPFSTQYEYSPSYLDFGHTDDNDHFWEQMDFLIPELWRVLQPGRIAAIHVKDRIAPGNFTGLGFGTVQPFSDETSAAFRKHGFELMARKTIVTDVVRENNQTYRLGWSEQCKDGTKMGYGMPEYLMVFRKPPTDAARSYADSPVVKNKKHWKWDTESQAGEWENPDGYSRARWQVDAHGFMRSNGNRPLMPEDLRGLESNVIFKLFRDDSLGQVYDYERHVSIAEYLETERALPSGFMLLQPQSWHPDVWTDIARMRTLNMVQTQQGKENHLCPMQFDIADRVIAQMSMPGEVVYDPFAGLGTVPYCAVKQGRRGLGTELNPSYFADALYHLRRLDRHDETPSLFEAMGVGS